MRIQKRTGTPRHPATSYFIEKITRKIEQTAARYNVSKSFVVAVACGFAFGIDEQEPINRRTSRKHSQTVIPFKRKHRAA